MGTPRNAVQDVEPLLGREHSGIREQEHAEMGSAQLRIACKKLFARWEKRHGFRPGAGEILVPNGYVPK